MFHKGVPHAGLFGYNNKKRRKKTNYLSSATNPFLVITTFTLAIKLLSLSNVIVKGVWKK
jgi:hypothetical protein